MNDLSNRELLQGTDDLLGKRAQHVEKLPKGDVLLAGVRERRDALAALPAEFIDLPLVDLLRGLDKAHDQWARAIHYLRLAIAEAPSSSESLRAAGALVASDYITGLEETRSPYGVEARRATTRAEGLADDQAMLEAVPTPDGRTLFDWISDFTSAGQALGDGLSDRADIQAGQPDVSDAGRLRLMLLSRLGRLRQAVRLHVELDAGLPRNLEAEIFAGLDELQRLAVQRRKTKAPKPTPPTA